MNIKDSVEQIILHFFQNCGMPEKVSVTFDPEVDLSDDAVGRSPYSRAQPSGVALKELLYVKLRRLIREHISKNIPKSSKIYNYTRRVRIP